jgi:hypothetical protein
MIRKKQQCSLGWVTLVTSSFVFLALACALCRAETNEFEDASARYQTTFNWQRHPAFNNGGITPNNSLISKSESMYTFSTTAHWGARVWQDGELYFNPGSCFRYAFL